MPSPVNSRSILSTIASTVARVASTSPIAYRSRSSVFIRSVCGVAIGSLFLLLPLHTTAGIPQPDLFANDSRHAMNGTEIRGSGCAAGPENVRHASCCALVGFAAVILVYTKTSSRLAPPRNISKQASLLYSFAFASFKHLPTSNPFPKVGSSTTGTLFSLYLAWSVLLKSRYAPRFQTFKSYDERHDWYTLSSGICWASNTGSRGAVQEPSFLDATHSK